MAAAHAAENHLDLLTLPEELGHISDLYLPHGLNDNSGLVVFIQDAHANPGAQHNIEKIARHFSERLGIHLILAEGGAGVADLSELRGFPAVELKEKVTSELVDDAMLSGIEREAILSPREYRFYGIETEDLYKHSGELYLKAKKGNKKAVRRARKLNKEMREQQKQIFNARLLRYVSQLENFESSDQLMEAVSLVANEARNLHIDRWKFKEVERFVHLILAEMNQLSQEQILKLRNDLDVAVFFDQFAELKKEVKAALIQNEQERLLDSRVRMLGIISKMLELKATPREFDEFEEKEEEFFRLAKETGFKMSNINHAFKFYKSAKQRDASLFENMVAVMKKEAANRALLVTGGFHTPGVVKQMRSEKIPFVLVSPNISAQANMNGYWERIQGKRMKTESADSASTIANTAAYAAELLVLNPNERTSLLSALKRAEENQRYNLQELQAEQVIDRQEMRVPESSPSGLDRGQIRWDWVEELVQSSKLSWRHMRMMMRSYYLIKSGDSVRIREGYDLALKFQIYKFLKRKKDTSNLETVRQMLRYHFSGLIEKIKSNLETIENEILIKKDRREDFYEASLAQWHYFRLQKMFEGEQIASLLEEMLLDPSLFPGLGEQVLPGTTEPVYDYNPHWRSEVRATGSSNAADAESFRDGLFQMIYDNKENGSHLSLFDLLLKFASDSAASQKTLFFDAKALAFLNAAEGTGVLPTERMRGLEFMPPHQGARGATITLYFDRSSDFQHVAQFSNGDKMKITVSQRLTFLVDLQAARLSVADGKFLAHAFALVKPKILSLEMRDGHILVKTNMGSRMNPIDPLKLKASTSAQEAFKDWANGQQKTGKIAAVSEGGRNELRQNEEEDGAIRSLYETYSGRDIIFMERLRSEIISSNASDPFRLTESLPITLILKPDLFIDLLPESLRPTRKPWRLVYTYHQNYQFLLAMYGNEEAPATSISEGPISYYGTKTLADYRHTLESVFQFIPIQAQVSSDMRQGISYLEGAHAAIVASPEMAQETVIKMISASLLNAGVLGNKYVASPGTRMKEHEMDMFYAYSLDADARQGQFYGTNSPLAQTDIPPAVGVSERFNGIPKRKWKIYGVGPIAALLALKRHPFVQKKYFGGQEPKELRLGFFGYGDIAAQITNVMLYDYPRTIGFRVSLMVDQDTKVYSPNGVLPERLVGTAASRVFRNQTMPLRDLLEVGMKDVVTEEKKVHWNEIAGSQMDVLVLAATPHTFTLKNAKQFKGKIVLEATPNCATPEAIEYLNENDILFVPYTTANIGGAFAARHEFARPYVYDSEFHLIDSITGHTLANVWLGLQALQENLFSRKKNMNRYAFSVAFLAIAVGALLISMLPLFNALMFFLLFLIVAMPGGYLLWLLQESHSPFFPDTIRELNAALPRNFNSLISQLDRISSPLAEAEDQESLEEAYEKAAQAIRTSEHPFAEKARLSHVLDHALKLMTSKPAEGRPLPYLIALRLASFQRILNEEISELYDIRQLKEDLTSQGEENQIRRRLAAFMIGRLSYSEQEKEEIIHLLGERLTDRNEYYRVRAEAAKALGLMGDRRAAVYLIESLGDAHEADERVRSWVLWALARLPVNWEREVAVAERNVQRARQSVDAILKDHAADEQTIRTSFQWPFEQFGQSLFKLAVLLRTQGRREEAIPLYREAVQNLSFAKREGNVLPLTIQREIAEVYLEFQKITEAREALLKNMIPKEVVQLLRGDRTYSVDFGNMQIPLDTHRRNALERFLTMDGFVPDVAAELAWKIEDHIEVKREQDPLRSLTLARLRPIVEDEPLNVLTDLDRKLLSEYDDELFDVLNVHIPYDRSDYHAYLKLLFVVISNFYYCELPDLADDIIATLANRQVPEHILNPESTGAFYLNDLYQKIGLIPSERSELRTDSFQPDVLFSQLDKEQTEAVRDALRSLRVLALHRLFRLEPDLEFRARIAQELGKRLQHFKDLQVLTDLVELYRVVLGPLTLEIVQYLAPESNRSVEERLTALEFMLLVSNYETSPSLAVSILLNDLWARYRYQLETKEERDFAEKIEIAILDRVFKSAETDELPVRLRMLDALWQGAKKSFPVAMRLKRRNLDKTWRRQRDPSEQMWIDRIQDYVSRSKHLSPLVRKKLSRVRQVGLLGSVNPSVFMDESEVRFYNDDLLESHSDYILEHGLIPLIHVPDFDFSQMPRFHRMGSRYIEQAIKPALRTLKQKYPDKLIAVGNLKHMKHVRAVIEAGANVVLLSAPFSSRKIKGIRKVAKKPNGGDADVLVLQQVSDHQKADQALSQGADGVFVTVDERKFDEMDVEVEAMTGVAKHYTSEVFGASGLNEKKLFEYLRNGLDFLVLDMDVQSSLFLESEIMDVILKRDRVRRERNSKREPEGIHEEWNPQAILIVEDDFANPFYQPFTRFYEKVISERFPRAKILSTGHGEEASQMLQDHPEIELVVLDSALIGPMRGETLLPELVKLLPRSIVLFNSDSKRAQRGVEELHLPNVLVPRYKIDITSPDEMNYWLDEANSLSRQIFGGRHEMRMEAEYQARKGDLLKIRTDVPRGEHLIPPLSGEASMKHIPYSKLGERHSVLIQTGVSSGFFIQRIKPGFYSDYRFVYVFKAKRIKKGDWKGHWRVADNHPVELTKSQTSSVKLTKLLGLFQAEDELRLKNEGADYAAVRFHHVALQEMHDLQDWNLLTRLWMTSQKRANESMLLKPAFFALSLFLSFLDRILRKIAEEKFLTGVVILLVGVGVNFYINVQKLTENQVVFSDLKRWKSYVRLVDETQEKYLSKPKDDTTESSEFSSTLTDAFEDAFSLSFRNGRLDDWAVGVNQIVMKDFPAAEPQTEQRSNHVRIEFQVDEKMNKPIPPIIIDESQPTQGISLLKDAIYGGSYAAAESQKRNVGIFLHLLSLFIVLGVGAIVVGVFFKRMIKGETNLLRHSDRRRRSLSGVEKIAQRHAAYRDSQEGRSELHTPVEVQETIRDVRLHFDMDAEAIIAIWKWAYYLDQFRDLTISFSIFDSNGRPVRSGILFHPFELVKEEKLLKNGNLLRLHFSSMEIGPELMKAIANLWKDLFEAYTVGANGQVTAEAKLLLDQISSRYAGELHRNGLDIHQYRPHLFERSELRTVPFSDRVPFAVTAERPLNSRHAESYRKLLLDGWVDGLSLVDLPLSSIFFRIWRHWRNFRRDVRYTTEYIPFVFGFLKIFLSDLGKLITDLWEFAFHKNDPLGFVTFAPGSILNVASGFRGRSQLKDRFLKAAALGAQTFLIMSGGGYGRRLLSHFLPMDSVASLRMARELKESSLQDKAIGLWAVENPFYGSVEEAIKRTNNKVEAGAEAIVTQPDILFDPDGYIFSDPFSQWLEEVHKQHPSVSIRLGIPFIESVEALEFWFLLVGLNPETSPEAARIWMRFKEAAEEGKDSFRALSDDWTRNMIRKAIEHPSISGIHLMPLGASTERMRKLLTEAGVYRRFAFDEVMPGILRQSKRVRPLQDLRERKEIEEAYVRLLDYGIRFPELSKAEILSGLSRHPVYLLDETLHPGNSFKILGSLNFVLKSLEEADRSGVEISRIGTQTTFNHGFALGIAYQLLIQRGFIDPQKTKLHINVGRETPYEKIQMLRSLGALVHQFESYEEAKHNVDMMKQVYKDKMIRVEHYEGVTDGYSSLFLDLFKKIKTKVESEDWKGKTVAVVVPTGAGGLVYGAHILKMLVSEYELNVAIKVIGVQTPQIDGLYQSLKEGKTLTRDINERIITLGIAVETPEIPIGAASRILDYMVLVDQDRHARPAAKILRRDVIPEHSGRAYEITTGLSTSVPVVYRDFFEAEGVDIFIPILTGANETAELRAYTNLNNDIISDDPVEMDAPPSSRAEGRTLLKTAQFLLSKRRGMTRAERIIGTKLRLIHEALLQLRAQLRESPYDLRLQDRILELENRRQSLRLELQERLRKRSELRGENLFDYDVIGSELEQKGIQLRQPAFLITFRILSQQYPGRRIRSSDYLKQTANISRRAVRNHFDFLIALGLLDAEERTHDGKYVRFKSQSEEVLQKLDQAIQEYLDVFLEKNSAENLKIKVAAILSGAGEAEVASVYPQEFEDVAIAAQGQIQMTLPKLIKAIEEATRQHRNHTPGLADVAQAAGVSTSTVKKFGKTNKLDLRRLGIWGLALPTERNSVEEMIKEALSRMRFGDETYAHLPIRFDLFANAISVAGRTGLKSKLKELGVDWEAEGIVTDYRYDSAVEQKWLQTLTQRLADQNRAYLLEKIEAVAEELKTAYEQGDTGLKKGALFRLKVLAPGHPLLHQLAGGEDKVPNRLVASPTGADMPEAVEMVETRSSEDLDKTEEVEETVGPEVPHSEQALVIASSEEVAPTSPAASSPEKTEQDIAEAAQPAAEEPTAVKTELPAVQPVVVSPEKLDREQRKLRRKELFGLIQKEIETFHALDVTSDTPISELDLIRASIVELINELQQLGGDVNRINEFQKRLQSVYEGRIHRIEHLLEEKQSREEELQDQARQTGWPRPRSFRESNLQAARNIKPAHTIDGHIAILQQAMRDNNPSEIGRQLHILIPKMNKRGAGFDAEYRKIIEKAMAQVGYSTEHKDRPELRSVLESIYLINNDWMQNLLLRVNESQKEEILRGLRRDHPLKQAVFDEVMSLDPQLILSQAEQAMHEDEWVREQAYDPVLNRYLSVRELFVRPTTGSHDLVQILFTELTLFQPKMYELQLKTAGEEFVRKHLRMVYLITAAMSVLSQDESLGLYQPEDAALIVPYLSREEEFSDSPKRIAKALDNMLITARLLMPADSDIRRQSLRAFLSILNQMKTIDENWKSVFRFKRFKSRIGRLEGHLKRSEREPSAVRSELRQPSLVKVSQKMDGQIHQLIQELSELFESDLWSFFRNSQNQRTGEEVRSAFRHFFDGMVQRFESIQSKSIHTSRIRQRARVRTALRQLLVTLSAVEKMQKGETVALSHAFDEAVRGGHFHRYAFNWKNRTLHFHVVARWAPKRGQQARFYLNVFHPVSAAGLPQETIRQRTLGRFRIDFDPVYGPLVDAPDVFHLYHHPEDAHQPIPSLKAKRTFQKYVFELAGRLFNGSIVALPELQQHRQIQKPGVNGTHKQSSQSRSEMRIWDSEEKGTKLLWEEVERIESQLFLALYDGLQPLQHGAITAERIHQHLEPQSEKIFGLLRDLKDVRFRIALLENDIFSYMKLVETDAPGCGLCIRVSTTLSNVLSQLGIKHDIEPVRVRNEAVHYFIAIEGNKGRIALDLTAGQFMPEYFGKMAVLDRDIFKPEIDSAVQTWLLQALYQNRRPWTHVNRAFKRARNALMRQDLAGRAEMRLVNTDQGPEVLMGQLKPEKKRMIVSLTSLEDEVVRTAFLNMLKQTADDESIEVLLVAPEGNELLLEPYIFEWFRDPRFFTRYRQVQLYSVRRLFEERSLNGGLTGARNMFNPIIPADRFFNQLIDRKKKEVNADALSTRVLVIGEEEMLRRMRRQDTPKLLPGQQAFDAALLLFEMDGMNWKQFAPDDILDPSDALINALQTAIMGQLELRRAA